jgi:hypothetical protein
MKKTILSALAVFILLTAAMATASCSMSKETVQKRVVTMLQEQIDADPDLKKLQPKVNSVTLVKLSVNENHYKGEASVTVFGINYKVNVNVTADKNTILLDHTAPSDLRNADTLVIDGLTFKLNQNGTGFTLTASDNSGGERIIPETIFGIPVTGIGRDAFRDRSSITGITIPNSVTSIGGQAFDGCTSLTSVTFQGTIKSNDFASYAFALSGWSGYIGDLRDKYLARGIGTYTRARDGLVWTKQ